VQILPHPSARATLNQKTNEAENEKLISAVRRKL
jgi:hypothetical protein